MTRPTKFSPCLMLFQKEMRLPNCNEVGPQNDVNESEEDPLL